MHEVIKMEVKTICQSDIQGVCRGSRLRDVYLCRLTGNYTDIFQRVQIIGSKKLENFLIGTDFSSFQKISYTQV